MVSDELGLAKGAIDLGLGIYTYIQVRLRLNTCLLICIVTYTGGFDRRCHAGLIFSLTLVPFLCYLFIFLA